MIRTVGDAPNASPASVTLVQYWDRELARRVPLKWQPRGAGCASGIGNRQASRADKSRTSVTSSR